MNSLIEKDSFGDWLAASQYILDLKGDITEQPSLEATDLARNGQANTVREYIEKEAWKHEAAGALLGAGIGAGGNYAATAGEHPEVRKGRTIAGGIGGAISGAMLGHSIGYFDKFKALTEAKKMKEWSGKSPFNGQKQQLANAENYLAKRLKGEVKDKKIVKNASVKEAWKRELSGAAIGATLGGGLGYASTNDSNKKLRNTLQGAVAGGSLGATGGILSRVYKDRKHVDSLVASANKTIDTAKKVMNEYDTAVKTTEATKLAPINHAVTQDSTKKIKPYTPYTKKTNYGGGPGSSIYEHLDQKGQLSPVDRLRYDLVKANPANDNFKKQANASVKEAWKRELSGAAIGATLGGGLGYASTNDSNKKLRNTLQGAVAGGSLGATGGILSRVYKDRKHVDSLVASANKTIDTAKKVMNEYDTAVKTTEATRLRPITSNENMSGVKNYLNDFKTRADGIKDKAMGLLRDSNKSYGVKNHFHDITDNSIEAAEDAIKNNRVRFKGANAVDVVKAPGIGRRVLNQAKTFAGDVGGGAAFGAGAGVFRASGHPGYEGETSSDVAKRYANNIIGGAVTGATFGGAKKLIQMGLAAKTAFDLSSIRNTVTGGLSKAAPHLMAPGIGAAAGAGIGALSADDGHRLQGAAMGGLSGAALGGLTHLGMGGKKLAPAVDNVASAVTPAVVAEKNMLPAASHAIEMEAAPASLREKVLEKAMPISGPSKQPIQLPDNMDGQMANLAKNPLEGMAGAQLPYSPNKVDILSNMYPIQQGGNTVGHVPIKAQTVRPQVMGPKAKPVTSQLPQDVQGIEEVKMAALLTSRTGQAMSGTAQRIFNSMNQQKQRAAQFAQQQRAARLGSQPQAPTAIGQKTANAIANFTNAAKGVGRAVMGNPVGRNAVAGAGVGAVGAGLSGGNPLTGAIAGAGVAGGGTALKMRGLGTNPGVKSLTGKLPSQTRMLPAPPQPQAAPVNISPGVQLMT